MDTKVRFLLLLLLIGHATFLLSQNSISGSISDFETGAPLPGVNIYIHELSAGTFSDASGNYKITDLPAGELIIHFSFIGYETVHKKVFFKGESKIINVAMESVILESDEVVISGNFTSTQHDNTIKISTVSIDQINRSGNPSLIESITETPGVNMISKGPGVVTPVIRGLSMSNILVLNNSVPMENFQFSEDHPYLINENGLERVEIIKGPASLIYGSGAVGGVINLIPEPVAIQGTITGDVNFTYFSNTAGLMSNIGLKGNKKGFVWGIRGGINTNKDYKQGNGNVAANTRFNGNNIKADIGLLRKFGTFRIFYEYSKNKFGMAVEPAFEVVTDNNRKNEAWFQDLQDHLIISQNKLFLGSVKLDINLAYQFNNRQLKGNPHSDEFRRVDMDLQTFSYRLSAKQSFSEKLKIIYGIQGMYQDNQNGDAPDHVLPNASINDISAYGLAQYAFNKVKLEAGVRYSYRNMYVPRQEAGGHSHEEEEHDEEEEEEEVFIQYDGQFDNVSVSLGSTFNLNEENLIRLNMASAFRSPNLAELTQYGMHGIRFEVGNQDLKSQQNLEIDLGYHLHTRHTTFDISAFYNHVRDYIFLSPTSDTTEEGTRIYIYSQTNANLYGGEAKLHIHPHPLHWLHFISSYSLVFGEQTDGNYLPRIPAQDLYFEVKLEKEQWKAFRDIYLKAGINVVFAQKNPSVFETATDGYNLLSMGFGFDIQLKRNRININVMASNLLNINYYDHLSTLKDLGIYNMGRNFSVNLRIPVNIMN